MHILGNLAQIGDEIKAVAGKVYPEFVYGGGFSTHSQEVPVFVFHSIDPVDFEKKLIYLSTNGYATVNSDEYYDWIKGNTSIPSKAVLLAIDDGVESVWQYGYPLLKKYGYTATVFIIPGYIKNRSRYFPSYLDFWNGKCTELEVKSRGDGYYNLLYWEEIKEMHDSGVMDFQSHSLYHHRIFKSERLAGFFKPEDGQSFYDWVLPQGYEKYVLDGSIKNHLGFPVYEYDSAFRSMKRYMDDEALRVRMEEYFSSLGGDEFYENEPRAGKIMTKEFRRLKTGATKGRFMNHGEMESEIRENLKSSKEIIEEKLNKKVHHLCYPYSLYCERVVELSKQIGYRTNYVGVRLQRRTNLQGNDTYSIVRLKHDYLTTLPGSNRTSLYGVIVNKLKKRAIGDRVL